MTPLREANVSVIVLCYNHGRFVSQCLDSIVRTGWPRLDLVVIDDASTDESVQVVRDWRRSHPEVTLRLVCHEVNQGVTRTLNEGCRLARGEVWIPIAADDELLPNGISLRVEYLADHPDHLAVFADCEVIDETGTRMHVSGIEGLHRATGVSKRDLSSPHLLRYELIFSWAIPGPVIALRSGFPNAIGPYDEGLRVEDWDLYLRLAAAGRLGFLDSVVSRYRRHGANFSQTAHRPIADDLARTAAKNAGLYHGILRMRLRAHSWQAPRPDGRPISRIQVTASHLLIRLLRAAYHAMRPWMRRPPSPQPRACR